MDIWKLYFVAKYNSELYKMTLVCACGNELDDTEPGTLMKHLKGKKHLAWVKLSGMPTTVGKIEKKTEKTKKVKKPTVQQQMLEEVGTLNDLLRDSFGRLFEYLGIPNQNLGWDDSDVDVDDSDVDVDDARNKEEQKQTKEA